MFLIWSFKHRQWWGPNSQGYTPHFEKAGRYNALEAGTIIHAEAFGESVPVSESVAGRRGPPTVPGLWSSPPENAEAY